MEDMQSSSKRNRNLPQQLTLDHVSPATRLLEKRRQMFEVQEALDAQKEEFQRREATFKRREDMLKKKDLELQESLIKFNKFLQENDSKRGRAEKKEKEEIKQRTQKEQEIIKLKEYLAKLKGQKVEMQEVLDKRTRYQNYLEQVLDVTEEYPEISELLMRYDTLNATHDDLINRSITAAQDNEDQRHRLQKFIKDKTDEILEYNNQIALLQKSYEASENKANKLQSETDRRLQDAAESTLQLGQVMMACDNIFQRCLESSHVVRKRVLDAEDEKGMLIEKLHFIRDYLTDLTAITRGFRPEAAKKDKVDKSEPNEPKTSGFKASAKPSASKATHDKSHTDNSSNTQQSQKAADTSGGDNA